MADSRGQQSLRAIIGHDYGWIAGQSAIMALAAVASPLEAAFFGRAYVPGHQLVAIVAGLALLVAALTIAERARRDLGDSVSMSPTPLQGAELVERGIYRVVRHPMYLAVIVALAGWAIVWGSLSGLVMTVIAVGFFALKARHEERLLVERYPGYRDYRRRVRAKFVPGLW